MSAVRLVASAIANGTLSIQAVLNPVQVGVEDREQHGVRVGAGPFKLGEDGFTSALSVVTDVTVAIAVHSPEALIDTRLD